MYSSIHIRSVNSLTPLNTYQAEIYHRNLSKFIAFSMCLIAPGIHLLTGLMRPISCEIWNTAPS